MGPSLSPLCNPPPLFLVTFSNLLMCPRCAAVCLLPNNWQLCHICQPLSPPPLFFFYFPPHSLIWWLLPLFSISCPISTSHLNPPSPALKSGHQLHFTNYHSNKCIQRVVMEKSIVAVLLSLLTCLLWNRVRGKTERKVADERGKIENSKIEKKRGKRNRLFTQTAPPPQ